VLELDGATFAVWREARTVLEEDHGGYLDDNAFVTMLAKCAFDEIEPSGKAKHQLAVTVCGRCNQGWQDGGGVRVPIDQVALARAECDAQHIGSLDAGQPARAHQDIPPATARLVWHRDASHCRAPGCRSARGLEIHHIVRRADGGGHEPPNLILLCSACHHAHHDGLLAITGTATDLVVRRTNEVRRTHVGSSVESEAKQALTGLGWKPAIARAAVDTAIGRLGPTVPLEQLIVEALRACPRPTIR
jgi:hypothetical protein